MQGERVSGERTRRATWLVGGVLGLVAVGIAIVVVFLLIARSRPEITEAQFNRVDLGDSKEDVSGALGGSGEGGSVVAGLWGDAEETPTGLTEQFDDCWSYSLIGSGVDPGAEVAVCFDSSNETVFTRVLGR